MPRRDSMGGITSDRASAMAALASVPEGMTLPELVAWRGPKATMYIRVRPTRLADSSA